MAEATNIVFKLIEPTGLYKTAIVTAVASATDTITLTSPELYVNTIKAVHAHVAATGVPVTYSYSANVLTRVTAGTGVSDVIVIWFE